MGRLFTTDMPRLMRPVTGQTSLLLVSLIVGLATCGCGVPGGNQEGPGHRSQRLELSPEDELELGRKAYQQVLQAAEGRILSADEPEVQRVRAVLERLVKASKIEPLQREINLHLKGYRFEWEANVV